MKFDYNIHPDNSPRLFKQTCMQIEKAFPTAKKRDLLTDVDGTTIQSFEHNGKGIKVFDDYDVGAVFVESDIDLSHLFN